MSQRSIVQRGLLYTVTLATLAGCSSIGAVFEPDHLDYKSATTKSNVSKLEVPPDLTQLQRDNRYSIPETNNGTATASAYAAQQANSNTASGTVTASSYAAQQANASTAPTMTTVAAVAPNSETDMHIEREGNQRWLVVKESPEALWPQLKDFWQDSGFLINIDSPETGIMETDWAENRAKIPQDIIRRTIGKAFDSLYSTGERDKFRTRLERGANGYTEVYITHRGAEEELVGQDKESSVWVPRSSDPELEAEFLARLMNRLGAKNVKAKTIMAVAPTPEMPHAKLVKSSDGRYVEMDEPFDHAWRRVGLALDRVGFTVEDRDRSQGLYFVRYVDQGQDAQKKAHEKGFFARLFSSSPSSDKDKAAQRYRVLVKSTGDTSQVTVLNNEGHVEASPVADHILSLLNDQLK
jgi:outer membrane protein assembly factor BamC